MNRINAELYAQYPYKPVSIRCGLDRYGFSAVLASQLGRRRAPRFFGNWLHGWIWWGAASSTDLHFDRKIQHKTHVVAHPHEQSVLEAEGFRKVFTAGLPFAYVPPTGVVRRPGSLLAMPPHSGDRAQLSVATQEYLSYVQAQKKHFDSVCVCLHVHDATPEVVRTIEAMGLPCVVGARPDDANALPRMRALFDTFEYVTSNTMGSHIAYAMYAGCRTTLCGPLHQWAESDFLPDVGHAQPGHAARLVHFHSREYVEKEMDYLLASSPLEGQVLTDRGAKFVGAANVLSGTALTNVLSWNLASQLAGYSEALRARFSFGPAKSAADPVIPA